MKWFYNWKMFYKINTLVLIMVVFMLGISFMGYYYYDKSKVAMNDTYTDALLAVKLINDANANMRMMRSVNMELILAPLDTAKIQNLLIQTKVLNGLINDSLDSYTPLAKEPFEVAKLAQVRVALQKYSDEWPKVVSYMDSGDKEAAYIYFSNTPTNDLDNTQTMLTELVDFSTQKAKSSVLRETINSAKMVKILLVFPLAVAVLAFIIGALMAQAIAKPLQIMLTNVQELASGNLKVTKLKASTRDEVGQLAQAFNLMTDSLSDLVRQVYTSSTNVASSAHQLLNITEQSSLATNQISQSIAQVAGGTEKQAGAVCESVAAMEQMNDNIQRVAEAGQVVAALTTKTTATTENGQRALTQAIDQMGNISRGTQVVKETISLLADGSEQIADIARSITGITEQTNLLALNAAIEAARAGEHGRGFSVVAEEVRKLAEQAKTATEHITALVVVNKNNIHRVFAAVDAEEVHVNHGIAVVNTAGHSLSNILNLVIEVSEQVSGIASSIQEMASGSQQIVTGIQHIGAVSQVTADQATTVSSAVEEFTASIDQINLSCQSLSGLAKDLHTGVSTFRI